MSYTEDKFIASAEVQEQRLAHCLACTFRQSLFGAYVCTHCNCVLAAKVKILAAKCPENKW